MFKNYRPLWWLLFVALVIFGVYEIFGPVTVGGQEIKTGSLVSTVTKAPDGPATAPVTTDSTAAGASGKSPAKTAAVKTTGSAPRAVLNAPADTTAKTILFVGDSMLDGLYPRLAAYAERNGHTLYAVIWYSSTSEIWGRSGKLASYIKRLSPDYIFLCLGSNELFVKDIAQKRDKYVKQIVSEIGNIPFVWIGPPNWREATGINKLIADNVPQGSFFESNGMKFDRAKDGAHPTHESAIHWMDSIVRWMPAHAAHPIRLELPDHKKARAKRVFVHQPNEK